jgi:hypothetical protein
LKVLYKPVPFILMGNILLLLAQVGCIFWNGCRRGRVRKSPVALSQEGVSLDGFALLGAEWVLCLAIWKPHPRQRE